VPEEKRSESEMIGGRFRAVIRKMEDACDRSGRDPRDVRIVTVSKGQPVMKIAHALEAGISVFGESRPREFADKRSLMQDVADVKWHFIGPLQRSNAKFVVGHCALIHSVDNWRLAQAISRRACATQSTAEILLQVNVSGEKTKRGFIFEELCGIAAEISALEGIRVRGLMTMAPHYEDPEDTRPVFRALAQLGGQLQSVLQMKHCELSMGMTNDYEVAVEEGATLVRVGRAVLGPRQ